MSARPEEAAAAILKTEFSDAFVDGMKARMLVSFYKYGPIATAYPDVISAISSLRQRLEAYERTGNTEYLIDVANFAMIEFMLPSHERTHFKAEDADASPGRIDIDGCVARYDNAGEDT